MQHLAYHSKAHNVDESIFNLKADWTDFYCRVKEELPPNMPECTALEEWALAQLKEKQTKMIDC